MRFSVGWRGIASVGLVSVCVLIGNVSFGQEKKAVEEKGLVWYDGSSPVSVAKVTETDLVVDIVFDQWCIDSLPSRKYYLIPDAYNVCR